MPFSLIIYTPVIYYNHLIKHKGQIYKTISTNLAKRSKKSFYSKCLLLICQSWKVILFLRFDPFNIYIYNTGTHDGGLQLLNSRQYGRCSNQEDLEWYSPLKDQSGTSRQRFVADKTERRIFIAYQSNLKVLFG